MKKNKGFLVTVLLILSLISCLLIINLIFSKQKTNICPPFEYEDILFEINSVVNRNFSKVDDMSLHIPVVFSLDADYLFAIDDQNNQNYFIIVKNISKKDLKELQKAVNSTKNDDKPLEIRGNDIYTYVVSSSEFPLSIDGIIKSFIYCN